MMKEIFVILSAIMLAIVFAVPAGATTDWDFYGSVRMQTFRVYQDENTNATGFNDRDSRWGFNTVSHVGATVQDGDIGGRFEYGHTNSDVTLRRLYGTWNFGPGELTVGKEYTPLHFVTNQVYDDDYGLRGFGGFFTFNPMIQVKIDGFKLALITPEVNNLGFSDVDTTLPKVEASYTLAMDTFSVKAFGGWSAFEVVDAADEECDVTCYIYGVAGVVNAGPVTLKAMIWGGQNVAYYGLTTDPEADAAPEYDPVEDEIKNNDGYGGVASIGVKFSDVVCAELGCGYISFEDDFDNAEDDEALAIYLQAPITLAQGVTIVPEIGRYDYKDDRSGADQGDETYFGAKWQINF
ncbi:MAG: hypothetical protein HF982_07295 [Desulfobacteraceae bacterium]|nr:hypothetical protein [Desulfobacteraceae bacterium]MBC2719377.1 hypothetical protein [Desulfobacteraceae bacterium]